MNAKIKSILPNSLAEELGIEVGDIILSINGTEVKDIIDFRFLMSDEYVEIEVQKPDGEVWDIEAEKDIEEELGVEFDMAIMDKAKRCSNNCMFCFIDQLPKGMRDTLYFKDDDSRLSFLQGNFVTLTNMKEEDIDRIIRYRISPINVSVHTTNPELRVKMLNNRFAGNILDRLKRLAEAQIHINAQIVTIPDVNNGEELLNTINDLYSLYPSVQNVAAVPIGITKYREGLRKVNTFDKDSAKKEIANVRAFQEKALKEIGKPFIRLSDEFYITAEEEIPSAEFYDGYNQIEDGIGMVRLLRDTIKEDIKKLTKTGRGSFSMVIGALAYDEIDTVANMIKNANNNIKIDTYKIINNYFGDTITVAGLLTGTDIIDQIKDKINTKYLIMSSNMFRKGYELADNDEQIMLDDYKVKDLEEKLDVKIIICDYTGEDLIDLINEYCEEE